MLLHVVVDLHGERIPSMKICNWYWKCWVCRHSCQSLNRLALKPIYVITHRDKPSVCQFLTTGQLCLVILLISQLYYGLWSLPQFNILLGNSWWKQGVGRYDHHLTLASFLQHMFFTFKWQHVNNPLTQRGFHQELVPHKFPLVLLQRIVNVVYAQEVVIEFEWRATFSGWSMTKLILAPLMPNDFDPCWSDIECKLASYSSFREHE